MWRWGCRRLPASARGAKPRLMRVPLGRFFSIVAEGEGRYRSSLMKENGEKPRRQSRAHRGWRFLNTGILLFAFFAPWLESCSPALPFPGVVTIALYVLTIPESILSLVVAVGGICILIYALTNFVRARTGSLPHSNRWLRIPLAGSIMGLLG